jgi:hypothetical protein
MLAGFPLEFGSASCTGQEVAKPRYTFAVVLIGLGAIVAVSNSGLGEATEIEKSMTYLTELGQNRQGVSWIVCRFSVKTLNGNDRKHSVQVRTT